MSGNESKVSFFRQSSWMIATTVGGGFWMMAVHPVAAKMGPEEYGVFYVLIRSLLLLSVPATGLQTVFARETAAAITEPQRQQLRGAIRSVLMGIVVIWAFLGLLLLVLQSQLLNLLKIPNPGALWMTILVVLSALCLPVLKGVLQGDQNFANLGWITITDGFMRFAAMFVIVLFLGGKAAGGMAAAWLGQLLAIGIAWYSVRPLYRGPAAPISWRAWFGQLLPLTLGTGAVLFLTTADVVYVRALFPPDESPFYMPGALVGFALLQFTVPLAVVMFPKIVRSAARSQKSGALTLTLQSTFALGVVAALGCTLFPSLPLRIIFFTKPEFWEWSPLVPWFAWCMLWLTLANVLINHLLAQRRFRIVPWLVLIAAAYGATLGLLHERLLAMPTMSAFQSIVQILTGFNLLLLGTAGVFVWVERNRT